MILAQQIADGVFKLHIDLGQLLIMGTMATIGYLIKRMIDEITDRLRTVEDRLYELSGDLQKVIGKVESWNGAERRSK